MDEPTFYATIAQRMGSSDTDARRTADATLEALGRQLEQPEAETLAGQLPGMAGQAVMRGAPERDASGVEGFLQRAAEIADDDEATTRAGALATFETMDEALTGQEAQTLRERLPSELGELLPSS